MKCERCGNDTHTLSGSWFNEEMICEECQNIEKMHPLFKECKEAERKAVINGNYNFNFGLPKDFEEFAKSCKNLKKGVNA